MIPAMHVWFRPAIVACAVFFAALGVWRILPEMAGHSAATGSYGLDATEGAEERKAAERAARLGVIRGDLWVEFALTYSGLVWSHGHASTQVPARETLERARAVVKTALTSSPHDARAWLLLAALGSTDVQIGERSAAALKMSYYTGPNDLEITPLRLLVSARPGIPADDELEQLLRNEVRTIIGSRPQLKRAIVEAYREATPAARRLIEQESIAYQDRELLASIRAGRPIP